MAYITLSKQNYFHNLELLSLKATSKDKIAVVLKDNAYGHGLIEMATLANSFGIKKAVVKSDLEADMIADLFDMIIVLLPNKDSKYSQTINSIDQLKNIKKHSKIHLKVDSGMHRNGILENKIQEALEIIDEKEAILEGVMTHFRSSDDLNSELFWQMREWERIKNKIVKLRSKTPLFHSFASSALLRATMEDDFARCGIATYGYSEMDDAFGNFDLKPVLKLYAQRISSKRLKKGQKIGYGGVGILTKDCVVSTYDIGYGDGFFRYDGKKEFYIDEFKVLGRISMDSTSLDSQKDEVIFIDDAKKLSTFFNTISYDILTKLSPTIKRVII